MHVTSAIFAALPQATTALKHKSKSLSHAFVRKGIVLILWHATKRTKKQKLGFVSSCVYLELNEKLENNDDSECR